MSRGGKFRGPPQRGARLLQCLRGQPHGTGRGRRLGGFLAGFGFGLMSVPLMAMTVTVRQAVVLSTMMGFVSATSRAAESKLRASPTDSM